MQEIEAKILDINKEKIEKTLKTLGAKKVFDGKIETLLFDFKDGSIIKTKNVLRLRVENNQPILTYKKVKADAQVKTAEEYSVEVSDADVMQQILECLGLKIIDDMPKNRLSYKLNVARFDIDQYLAPYDFVPTLLEIEADSVAAVHEYAKTLGFTPKDCLPWSTIEVIEYYRHKK